VSVQNARPRFDNDSGHGFKWSVKREK